MTSSSLKTTTILSVVGAGIILTGCVQMGTNKRQYYRPSQPIAHMSAPVQAYTPPVQTAAQPTAFAAWKDTKSRYRLYPGDEVEVTVYDAPELDQTLTIAPDGRLLMPYADPVMASGRTIQQTERSLAAALAKTLKNPAVQITPTSFGSQRVFVGGEVQSPGVYDMPGPIDSLQAIILAGGATAGSKLSKVALIRRGDDGRPMMKVLDIEAAKKNPSLLGQADLQRFDVVYVPRNSLAEVGVFMTNFRNALPVQFGLAYNLNDQ